MQWSEKIDQIAPAFLKAQIALKGAHKDSTNPHFRSKYADLTSVYDACKDALHNNGIAILQGARNEINTYGVDTMLLHTSGQWIREVLMLAPSKADPQGAGSALSYARRYAMAAMVGVMAEDDDANIASHKPQTTTPTHTNGFGQPQRPLTGPEAVERAHQIIGARQASAKTSGSDKPGDYVITFGKFKGQKVRDISEQDLNSYAAYLLKTSGEKPLSPSAKEFITNAEKFLSSTEDPSAMEDYDYAANVPVVGARDDFPPIPF